MQQEIMELTGQVPLREGGITTLNGKNKTIRLRQQTIKLLEKRILQQKRVVEAFHYCSKEHYDAIAQIIYNNKVDLEYRIEKLKKSIKSAEKLRADQVIKALDYALTFGVDTELARIESARINQFEKLLHCRKITLNRILKKAGRKEIT